MADNNKAGTMPAHAAESGKAPERGTLLPMLIGGLVLITVGMTVIAILV